MDKVETFPMLRAKRHPIKTRLAGDGLERIGSVQMDIELSSDRIEAEFYGLCYKYGIEIAEEVYQRVADRVVERMRNANVGG